MAGVPSARVGQMENLREIPVIVVLAHVADLLERDPGLFAPILQRGRIGVRGQQRAEGRRAKLVQHIFDRLHILPGTDGFADDVEVDWAEDNVVGLVPRPDVLDEPGVGIGPLVILFPAHAGIAARHFNEG